MKKIFSFILLGVMSMLMAFSATALPLDGAFDPTDIITTANKNEVKSLVSAPTETVIVKKSTNLADKSLIKTLSTETMKTSAVHIASLVNRLSGSGFVSYQVDKPGNVRQNQIYGWSKRPIPTG